MSDPWGSIPHAARVRNYMRQLVISVLHDERPDPRFGTVIELETVYQPGRCKILYQNDDTPVSVKTYGVRPSAVGQVVIVDGPRRMRYITQIIDAPFLADAGDPGQIIVPFDAG
jgi:hypothetical protein